MREKLKKIGLSLTAEAALGLALNGVQAGLLVYLHELTKSWPTPDVWLLGLLSLGIAYSVGPLFQAHVLDVVGTCPDTATTTTFVATGDHWKAIGVGTAVAWGKSIYNPVDYAAVGSLFTGDPHLFAANLSAKVITGFTTTMVTHAGWLAAHYVLQNHHPSDKLNL